MSRLACSGRGWQVTVLAALVSFWLGLSGLLLVARGDPETFLRTTLGHFSRPDAFEHISGVSICLWVVHSSLVTLAIAAAWRRRPDVLVVILIGPVIALMISLLGEQWSDPNWFVVISVCTIGWGVGTVVGGAYWCLKQKRGSA
jgi:hypothetical protein